MNSNKHHGYSVLRIVVAVTGAALGWLVLIVILVNDARLDEAAAAAKRWPTTVGVVLEPGRIVYRSSRNNRPGTPRVRIKYRYSAGEDFAGSVSKSVGWVEQTICEAGLRSLGGLSFQRRLSPPITSVCDDPPACCETLTLHDLSDRRDESPDHGQGHGWSACRRRCQRWKVECLTGSLATDHPCTRG